MRKGMLPAVILLFADIHFQGMNLKAQQQATPPAVVVPPAPLQPTTTGPMQKFAPGDIKTEEVRTVSAPAALSDLPPTTPTGRPVIGVALEGGGALGLAHIGVLKWMEEHHIPVDRISGTSMGCLVSAMYAAGQTTSAMEELTESDLFSRVLTLRSSYASSSFRRKQDQSQLPQALTVGLKKGVSFRNSLLADASLNSFLTSQLFTYDRDGIDFNQLPIPLRCIATDLNTMKPVIFEGGPIPVAVRASISIPGVFAPVIYQGHYLVDGAIMDNLPTDIVKRDLHSDVVIGVHLAEPELVADDVKSLLGVFGRAYSAGTALNERRGEALADLLISVDTSKYSTRDYGKAKELIAVGYQAAASKSDMLLRYALNDAEWNSYLSAKNDRRHQAPGILTAIKVEGKSPSVKSFVEHDLSPLKGKQMDPQLIAERLTQIQADGSLETRFETFDPADPQSKQRPISPAPDTGLLVQFRPVASGPPFLLFGPALTAETSNVTRSIFAARVIDQNLGGYGSELRTDIRAGYLTQLSTEYYRRLDAQNWYIQPRLNYLRQPIYIWQNQHRIAEQFDQEAGGGLDIGRTVSNQLQFHAGWTAQVIRWRLVTGEAIGPPVSGTAQTALLHLDYDGSGSSTLSRNGLRFNVSAGSLVRGPANETAPLFKFYALKTISPGPKTLVVFAGEANTYFRYNVSQPMRFTLGGPFSLTASSVDEYRGTDTILFRSGYLRQIASLPTGLGQGVYMTFAYEGGEIWSPENRAILRQDGLAGLTAITPVGAITFGTAIGDAGRRKVFFTFGRIF